MVETTADESATLALKVGGAEQLLKFGDDMVVGTRSGLTVLRGDAQWQRADPRVPMLRDYMAAIRRS